jgi:hypothetical protein
MPTHVNHIILVPAENPSRGDDLVESRAGLGARDDERS